jgi:SAM-dependent methyltransferase
VRLVTTVLERLDLPESGLLLDFGCSDGYVLSRLRDLPALAGWRFAGYERAAHLVQAARMRSLPGAEFQAFDLNDPAATATERGDVVLCLETLEHVGRVDCAVAALDRSVRQGGVVVVTMPNEVGPVGLAKLVVRPLVRRHAYRGFFETRREAIRYAAHVIVGADLSVFRTPARPGWGPHLGFDRRVVRAHIERVYVRSGRWAVLREEWTLLRVARVSVFRVLRAPRFSDGATTTGIDPAPAGRSGTST